jgi:hypothetical protein
MRLSSQNNAFKFNLPQDFIEPWLVKQFQILMDKNFIQYATINDYVSSTIKEIVFPGLSFDVAEQKLRFGKKVSWKEAGSVFDKFTNELDVTFRSVDSHLNYFILLESLIEFYENTNKHQIEMFDVDILDKDGDIVYTVLFKEVLLKSISEKRLSYQRQDLQEDTFTITFRYNFIDVRWKLTTEQNAQYYSKTIFDIPINFGNSGKMDTDRAWNTFQIRPKVG